MFTPPPFRCFILNFLPTTSPSELKVYVNVAEKNLEGLAFAVVHAQSLMDRFASFHTNHNRGGLFLCDDNQIIVVLWYVGLVRLDGAEDGEIRVYLDGEIHASFSVRSEEELATLVSEATFRPLVSNSHSPSIPQSNVILAETVD